MRYFCDDARHIVCVPYTVANLHLMAADLNLKRCWFHASAQYPHYDMPKRRIKELTARCEVVSTRVILAIVKGEFAG